MSIRIVCSKCGKRRKVRDKLAGQEAKCRKCGGLIPVPTPGSEPTGEVSVTSEPTTPTRQVWHVGSTRWNKWSLAAAREIWLGRRLARSHERAVNNPDVRQVYRPGKTQESKSYQRSVVVGTIGHVMLKTSILGIFLNLVLLISTISSVAGIVSGMTDIPESIIEKVSRVEVLTEAEIDSLTPQQRRVVKPVQVASRGVTLGPPGIFGEAAVFGVVAWFVVGVVGRLLILKGKALQCDALDEIVAPS